MNGVTISRPGDHSYTLAWMIFAGAVFFALFVSWDMGFIQAMLATDSSYLSGVSILLFAAFSAHAIFHIVENSRAIHFAEAALSERPNDEPPPKLLRAYLNDIRAGGKVIEIYADQLRAPVELGWFIIDLLIKLGLIGTIIGFIMILVSLTAGPLPGASDIQRLLVTLGGGMGTALYTTLAGLVAASLLAVQYIMLGRCVERLIGALIRLEARSPATGAAS
ncbi:MAG: MotA/TolQ/ExbB proton channel family protein [Hyphomicrobiales bacterium]|nr:MotA/TolQ/ExbB proton channel family protein [Hyphomicrobiales bacterium]